MGNDKVGRNSGQTPQWRKLIKVGIVTNLFTLSSMLPSSVAALAGYDMWNPYGATITEFVTGRELGPDTRTKVSKTERLTSPIVRIKMVNEKGLLAGHCTGAAIAPTAFVTAAHCLEGDVQQLWLDRGGEFGHANNQIAKATDFAKTTKFVIHDQYDGEKNDIGLVLTDQPVGSWLEIDEFPVKDAASLKFQSAGYPDDKEAGTMWQTEYKGFKNWKNALQSSAGVAFVGQSGAPIYKPNKDKVSENDGFSSSGKIYGVLKSRSNDLGTNGEESTFFTGFDKADIHWIKEKIDQYSKFRTQ